MHFIPIVNFLHPLFSTALLRRQTQTIMTGASSHKIDYVTQFQGILELNGYQNCIIGPKITAILVNR